MDCGKLEFYDKRLRMHTVKCLKDSEIIFLDEL